MKRIIMTCINIVLIISLMGCGQMQKHTEINKLIANGENEKVIKMVEDGYKVNQTSQNSSIISFLTQNEGNEGSPLYTACEYKNYDMIKFLLENGADPNYSGYKREYPFEIFLSKAYTDEEAFELFLEKGADIEKYLIKSPVAALMSHYRRADADRQEIMERELRVLISSGVTWRNENLNEQYGGYSLLHFVAATDRTEFMKELLSYDEAAEYINTKTNMGETPYDIAKQNNQVEMCVLLKAYQPNDN